MTLIPNDEKFINSVERFNPDIVNLARVVSLAVRIEPELLRKARLELLPQIDAGAEAELWFSPLAQSQTPLSMVLLPEAAKVLRRRLAENQEELGRAWEILREIHKNASPTLILEEEVTWLALTNRADAVTQIQNRLEEVLVSLANEDRPGLARWAARALPLLPEAARTSQAARVLSVIAGVKTGKPQILKDHPSAGALQKWLRLISPRSPSDVPVGVRLLERVGVGVGPQRVVEFSNPPVQGAREIATPRTNPFIFEVSWEDQSGQHFEQVSLAPFQMQTCSVGSGPVKIRTAIGKTHILTADDPASDRTTAEAQIPASIPRSPLPFVGRAELVKKIKKELLKKRLIALTGIAGSGKTALAAEVARLSVDIYRQRIVWINADAHVRFSFSTMLDEIGTQLGRADLRHLSRKEKYRAISELISQSPLLLVLDGFELLPNRTQKACQRFLAAPSLCSVLITTRQSIESTKRIEVGNLSSEESKTFLDHYVKRTEGPSFIKKGIWEPRWLIKRAQGNPLVMILLLALLRAGNTKDNPAHFPARSRQTSYIVNRVIDLLPSEERDVLTALALFVPDASRDALALVSRLSTEGFDRAVKELVSKCLIGSTAGGERLLIEGAAREIIRHKILDLDSTLKPHPLTYDTGYQCEPFIEYFRLYAEQYVRSMPQNFDALEIERENLLGAVELAFKMRDDKRMVGITELLNSNLGEGFLFQRGYRDEALWVNELALTSARRLKREDLQAQFTQHMAYIHQSQGELPWARKLYLRAMATAKRNSDLRGFAVCLYQLGGMADAQGKLKKAEKFYRQSVSVYKDIHAEREAALAQHRMARLAQRQGRRQEAEKLYQGSLKLLEEYGTPDQSALARVRLDFGRLLFEMGRFMNAQSNYINSLKMHQHLGDQRGMAETYYELGRVAYAQDDIKEAEKLFKASMDIWQELGEPGGIAKNLLELGRLARARAELDAATTYSHRSLEISRTLDDKLVIASALLQLSDIAQVQRQFDEAQRFCDESLKISTALDNEQGIANALYQSGVIANIQGKPAKAMKLFSRAFTIFRRLDLPIEFVLKELYPLAKSMSGSTKRSVPSSGRRPKPATVSKKSAGKTSAARKSRASSKRAARSASSVLRASSVSKKAWPTWSSTAKGRSKKKAAKSVKAKK